MHSSCPRRVTRSNPSVQLHGKHRFLLETLLAFLIFNPLKLATREISPRSFNFVHLDNQHFRYADVYISQREIITWPPTMPWRSLTKSVWLQALLLQGATCRRSFSKSKSASWLWTKFLMFQGRSLCPSIKGTSERTCRTVSNLSLGDARCAVSPSAGRGPTLPIQLPIDNMITLAVQTPLWPPHCNTVRSRLVIIKRHDYLFIYDDYRSISPEIAIWDLSRGTNLGTNVNSEQFTGGSRFYYCH